MNNAKIIFAPDVDRAITQLIDYVDPSDIPTVITFLEQIQTRLVNVLSAFPESGTRFQGKRRTMTIRGYTFIYEYRRDLHEIHVLEMNAPGQSWR